MPKLHTRVLLLRARPDHSQWTLLARFEYHLQQTFFRSSQDFFKLNINIACFIPTGFFCSEGSPTSAPVSAVYGDICPPGHYCEIGSAVPTPCPVGSWRPDSGGKGTDDCMPCPGGTVLLHFRDILYAPLTLYSSILAKFTLVMKLLPFLEEVKCKNQLYSWVFLCIVVVV